MKTRNQILFTLVAVCCSATALPVMADAATDKVETKIEATGLKFSKTESGSFRFVFDEGDGRSQLVIVSGNTTSYHDVQFVEVWSTAVVSETRPVDANQMRELLGDEDGTLGHWCLIKPSDPGNKWRLYYSIQLPVSASPEAFRAAIGACSTKADKKEKELVGTDDN